MRDGFIQEASQCVRFDVRNDSGNHVALSLYRSRHDRLTRSDASGAAIAVVPVPVLGLTANECLIDFDIANQFLELAASQCHADFIAHEPRGFVGTKSHIATDLKRANPLFTGQHQMNNAEPFTQRLVGILEDRPDQDREAIADSTRRALIALPIEVFRMLMVIGIPTTRTAYTIWPPILDQVGRARSFIWKLTLKISERHLMDVE